MYRPRKAFVLAAGLGTRMRPLTDNLPKPLIEVEGRTMLDRALDRLKEFGIEEVIINAHYLAEQIEAHAKTRTDLKITVSVEKDRLETGGGLFFAREKLGNEPLFVISSDIIWKDEGKTALEELAEGWTGDALGLLLLAEVAGSYGYDGKGDFKKYDDGRIEWRDADSFAPYVFTGLQIIDPKLFDLPAVHEMAPSFALNKVYSLYLDKFRAVKYSGKWFHIGTPESLAGVKL